MSRAENRHYAARERNHVRQIIRDKWRNPELAKDVKFVGRYVGYYPCSCPMCGNERRHFGKPTLQELKAGRP